MSTHCLEPLTEDRCTRWNSAPKNSAKSRRPKSRKSTGQEALANEELLQTWVAHHLMIIGEACRALSADFRTTHPAEVRALAAGLRNVIVHEYFGIDLGVVWNVIERDLPALKERVRGILAQEG